MSTKQQSGDACHYADGTHRGSAASTDGRELERFEARMRAHLADGHRHQPDPQPQWGGWASAIDRWMDQTGTCHYQVSRLQGDLRVVSFACGVQDRHSSPIYAGGTYATREECEQRDGTHACQVCLRIADQHPPTPGWEGTKPSDEETAERERRLLEQSSLGTPTARSLASRTSPEVVRRILNRAKELEEQGDDAP